MIPVPVNGPKKITQSCVNTGRIARMKVTRFCLGQTIGCQSEPMTGLPRPKTVSRSQSFGNLKNYVSCRGNPCHIRRWTGAVQWLKMSDETNSQLLEMDDVLRHINIMQDFSRIPHNIALVRNMNNVFSLAAEQSPPCIQKFRGLTRWSGISSHPILDSMCSVSEPDVGAEFVSVTLGFIRSSPSWSISAIFCFARTL